MPLTFTLSTRLNNRRKKLGLSCAALAGRTGLSLRTVQRIMSGEEGDPGFSTVASLCEAMGMRLEFGEIDVAGLRRKQAEQKADRIVAMVQGTSGLESQALAKRTLRDLREKTVIQLLAGSNHKLWAK